MIKIKKNYNWCFNTPMYEPEILFIPKLDLNLKNIPKWISKPDPMDYRSDLGIPKPEVFWSRYLKSEPEIRKYL